MLKYLLNLVNMFFMAPKPNLYEKFEETLRDLEVEDKKAEESIPVEPVKTKTVKTTKKAVTKSTEEAKPAVIKPVKTVGTTEKKKRSPKKSK